MNSKPLADALRGGLADTYACGFITGTLAGSLKQAQAALVAADLAGEPLADRDTLQKLVIEANFALTHFPRLAASKRGHKKPRQSARQPRLF